MTKLLALAGLVFGVAAHAQSTAGGLTVHPSDHLPAVLEPYLAGCGTHCAVTFALGDYHLTATILTSNTHLTLSGSGAILHGSPSLTTMVDARGDDFTVSGLEFDTNGSTYGVLVTGRSPHVLRNSFHGASGLYVKAQSATGFQGSGNTFDGTRGGCASQSNIGVVLSTNFEISGNTVTDTCGFSFETIASHHGTIAHNRIQQHTLSQTATASAGQTAFNFTWPADAPRRYRVWVEVNGIPRSDGVARDMHGASTAVRFPAGLRAGDVVTALSWTALENIQFNSLSYAMTSTGNVVDGSGDAGEDVVSDFHAVTEAKATARQNQTVFTFNPSTRPVQIPAVMVGGHALAGDEVTLVNTGGTFTATVSKPQPAGAVVSLVDIQLNQPASTPPDFPSDVTFTGENVRNTAAICLGPEIAAQHITVTGGTLTDCGLGVQYGSMLNAAIYTAGAIPMVIRNVTIGTARPVNPMQSAIAILQPVDDDGSLDKRVKISGISYSKTFASHLNMPTGTTRMRQSSIDVDLPTIDYPERPDFDTAWRGPVPAATRYFHYGATNAGVVHEAGSVRVPQGVVFDIQPTDALFFGNTITRVVFQARVNAGSPTISLFSSIAGGSLYPITIHPTDTNWHPYSISLGTVDLDRAAPFLRVDGSNGSLSLQHVTFSASPLNDGMHPYPGARPGGQR